MSELNDQYHALKLKYSELEREYENLLVRYRNTEEELDTAHRTSAKYESQLYGAARQVENAKRIQGEFLDTVSHELLTPLNGILGMARILEELPLKSEIKESIDTIRSCGEDLERILKNMLDYIHLSKGEIDIIPSAFDLDSSIESVIQEYSSTIYLKNLEVTYLPDHGGYDTVEIDRDRFEQVLHVLLSNAVKFTHEGHIIVYSQIKPRSRGLFVSEPGHDIILTVKDTGIGIETDNLQDIFRPFEQLDSSRNRQYGGIGIGLTLCKEIITQMGGSIMIDSEPKQGSVFAISLPANSVKRSRRPNKRKRPEYDVDVAVTSLHDPNIQLLRKYLSDYKVNHAILEPEEIQAHRLPSSRVWLVDYPSNPIKRSSMHELIATMHKNGFTTIGLLPGNTQLLPNDKGLIDVIARKPISAEKLLDALSFARMLQNSSADEAQLDPRKNTLEEMQTMRVLLADNNPVNKKIVLHLLGMLGCIVDTVHNLEELETKFKGAEYSCVVINPSIDTSINLGHLREFTDFVVRETDTLLLAITGRNSTFSEDLLAEAGFHEHVTLPIKLDDFARALQVVEN